MKLTKQAFKELLNKQDSESPTIWKNGRYHQTKRLYGDYLYSQDKIMFDVNYNEWVRENSK